MFYIENYNFESEMQEALVFTYQLSNFDDVPDETIKTFKYTYMIYSSEVKKIRETDGFKHFVSQETILKTICPALDAQDCNEGLDYTFVHGQAELLCFTNKPISPVWFRIASGWYMNEIINQRKLWDFVAQYRPLPT